jgi:hypothetical protein
MDVAKPRGVQITREKPLTKQGKHSKAIGLRDELAFPKLD